jgi:hypothetical protein
MFTFRFEDRLMSLFETMSSIYRHIPTLLKAEQLKVTHDSGAFVN